MGQEFTGGRREASFSQERLWFMEKLVPGACVFNMLNGLLVEGEIDRDAFRRSVLEIVRRHEVLRTNLLLAEGRVLQAVSPVSEGVMDFIDLSGLPEGERLEEARRRAVGFTRKPYDLSKDMLFRAVLFKMKQDEHILALLTHHSVFDGWSLRIFAGELVSLYSSFIDGKPSPLPELEMQYGEYSDRQRRRYRAGKHEAEWEYWRGRLGGDLSVLELQTDRPRRADQAFRGEMVTLIVPASLKERLKRLGAKNGCTLYMTLLAAFYVFLQRYSGSDDLVVGCPVAGRGERALEEMIGFFINTLPIRADLSGDPIFLELLKKVRGLCLETYSNQNIPFDKVVERLSPHRDLAHSPIYQVLFQLRNYPKIETTGRSISLEPFEFGWVTSQVELMLDAQEVEEGIRCEFEFPSELFDRATVERMARHWLRLLEGIAGDPGLAISEYPIMNEGELQELLYGRNRTQTDYPRGSCVEEIFEGWAAGSPDSVAIVHGSRSITYREVNEKANQLAHLLLDNVATAGEPIGVCMERSPEMVIAYLAILKAGGAYVPLDPADPPGRLGVIIGDMNGRTVVTKARHVQRLPKGFKLICLDGDSRVLGGKPKTNPGGRKDPGRLAYIIYTSGSTGAPKGVCCPHRGIVRLVVGTNYVRFAPGDTVVHASNPTFDPTTFEVWGALLNGARLLIIDRETLLSNQELAETLRREGADVLFMTTTLFHLKSQEAPGTFGSLREVFVGGEAMEPASARRVLEASPPKRLINFYGPTENTGFSTFYEVRGVPKEAVSIPIGKNISNSTSYILDRNLRPVPLGVKGEIFVSGDGVGLGYFGKPELTASSFLPNPFVPGATMYRTGDMGRLLPDGNMEYLGRTDSQVKIRGFRVEAEEVEAVLASHPSVKVCAVLAKEAGSKGDRRLVAYVLPVQPGVADAEKIRGHMAERLPDYMVPTAFMILESLPLTPTGKINRRALPEPPVQLASEGGRFAEEGALESRLTRIWEEALGVRGVKVDDDFFRLGGHSLMAVRLFAEIEKEFGVRLPIATIFRAPTVAQLAKEVGGGGTPSIAYPKGAPITIERLVFSSGQQDSDPAIMDGDGGVTTYGMLRGQVRAVVGGLTSAGYGRGDRIALVLSNGPMLASAIVIISTAFGCAPLNPGLREGEFRHHFRKLKVRAVIVEKGLDSPAREAAREMGLEVLEARKTGATGMFDLEGIERAPSNALFSEGGDVAFLLHTSGTTAEPKLVPLTQTNICLTAFYVGRTLAMTRGDRCLSVLPLFHGYGIITLLITLLTGGSIVCLPGYAPETFFRLLDELKPTWYPAVPPVHKAILEGAASHRDIVSRSRLRLIRSAAAPLSPSLMQELEDCFNAPVIEAYGMTEAFAIGLNLLPPKKRKPGSVGVAAGPEVAIMDESGNFVGGGGVGEIVVRGPNVMRGYEGDDEENARAFINGWFRTGDLGHIDAEGYIFIDGRVKEEVNRGGEKVTPNEVDGVLVQHPAVFDAAAFGTAHEVLGEDLVAAVVLRDGAKASEEDLIGFVSERLALYKTPSKIFFVEEIPKGPSGKILRRRLSEAVGLKKAAEESMLASVGEKEPRGASALGEGVIEEWNGASAPYPSHLCIHQIFEGVVSLDPSRTAIRHNSVNLTYGELNARANRIARRLMAEGAGPGQFIGVCMERSPDFVISCLAILKAGASYVPIFPPRSSIERITSYIEYAGIRLVLTKKVYEQLLPEGVKKLYFQSLMDQTQGLDGGNVPVSTMPEGAAYLLFVPDATGKPKGVCVPHRAVSRLVLNTNYVSIGTEDVVALQSGPDTSLAVWEMWGALLNGARLSVFDMRTILSPKGFAGKLVEEGVTVLGLNTSYFNLYASEAPEAFGAVKTLIFTGDVADPASVRGVIAGGPPGRLINAYGSTETGCFSMWHLIERPPEGDAPIPIGIPVSNTTIHILDDAMRPVPPGSEGELWVGGEGVALGYLSQSEATMGPFLPDPFGKGGRIYKTGDRVRLNPGGWVEFLGRRDRQIKMHGYRAELGEIESALTRQPGVRACSVAYLRVGNSKERSLVAYVVPSGPNPPDPEELHENLQRTILEYMIPSRFIWVDELPRMPSGDRMSAGIVPQGGVAGVGKAEASMEPGDEVERRVAAIWSREMGIQGIGPEDNFFEMGGYSLMAVRIISRMEEEFATRLGLATIYRNPTVAGIARELKKARHKALRSLIPMRAEGGRARLFLVHAADGEVYNYGKLVNALGEDQPVYAFRAAGIHGEAPLPATIGEMARSYIGEMKVVQPRGPYHLAGWCAGGAIAFEMARQLRDMGEAVGFLGILDTEAPGAGRWRSRRRARSLLFKEIMFLGLDILRYARRRRAGKLEVLQRVVGIEKLSMRSLGIITTDEEGLPGESAPLPDAWKAVILNQIRAIHAYEPGRYDGGVTVFKREMQPLISSPDPADGWGRLAAVLEVITIKGRIHGDMLKPPSVADTAEKIRQRIDRN